MSLTSGLAIYFIIWWLVFFCTLPFGVRTQAEDERVVAGSAPSAPVRPLLGRKVIATTVISLLAFLAVRWVIVSDYTLDDIPFLPRIEDVELGARGGPAEPAGRPRPLS